MASSIYQQPIVENKEDSQSKYHFFTSFVDKSKALTVKLYTQTGIKSEMLESGVKRLNTFSEPYIQKVTDILDNQVDNTMTKLIPVKDNLIKTGKSLKENIIQKGKNNMIVKKADNFTNQLIDHLEGQINQMAVSLKKDFKPQEQEGDEQQKSIIKKTKSLAKQVNQLSYIVAQVYWEYLKNMKPVVKIGNLDIKRQATDAKIFGQVVIEISKEIIVKGYTPLKQIIFVTSVQKTLETFENGKKVFILGYQKINKDDIIKMMTQMKEKCKSLGPSTITFYQDHMKIEYFQGFYKKNMDKIKKDVQTIIEETDQLQSNIRNSANNLYSQVLEEYKRRKEMKNIEYEEFKVNGNSNIQQVNRKLIMDNIPEQEDEQNIVNDQKNIYETQPKQDQTEYNQE